MSTTVAEAAVAPLAPRAEGQWRGRLRARLVILDALLITVAVIIAFTIRFGRPAVDSLSNLDYFWCAVSLALAWLGLMFVNQTYKADCLGIGTEEYRRVGKATFAVFGMFAIISMILKLEISRSFLAVALPLGLFLLFLGRWVNRTLLSRARGAGRFVDPVVVIGAPEEVRYVAQRMQSTPAAGYVVAAVATGGKGPHSFELSDGDQVTELGALEDVIQGASALGARSIIVAGHALVNRQYLRTLSWDLEGTGIGLALASRMTDVAGPRIHWRPIEGLPLISVEMPRYSGLKFYMKRVFDLVVSVVGLIVLSPLLLVIGIAVKLDSRGPIFFRQTRVGVNGATFQMTKFRSMIVDAEKKLAELQSANEGSGALFKMKDDPRLTRVGRLIRRYSLDELPQLFDVAAGSMSLVGPRPPLPTEVQKYEEHVHRRLNVKPGITGPWQVGGRSNLSWEESVRKDLYYVENWSLAGDVIILFKTVRAVLMRDGAY